MWMANVVCVHPNTVPFVTLDIRRPQYKSLAPDGKRWGDGMHGPPMGRRRLFAGGAYQARSIDRETQK